jgi:hypothetical protein
MKKRIITILAVVLFISCKSVHELQSIQGEYYKQGNDYQYDLVLNRDSSFILSQKYFEVNSTCQGKWIYFSKDTLLLQCNPENVSAQLQSGYMSEREKKVIVVSRNKLQLGKTILKRK